MFRSLILAAVRAKSPCCHRLNYKLAIVTTTADTGTVATGATVTTGTVTMSGAATAGGNMIMVCTAAGIKTTPTSVVIAKAGTTVMTAVAAGIAAVKVAVDMATATVDTNHKKGASRLLFLL